MKSSSRFPPDVVEKIRKSGMIRLRAGRSRHRFIPLWVVIVQGRIFVRSWSLKSRSWYRTLQRDPVGVIQVSKRAFAFRSVHTRSERLKDAVSAAYLAKYHTPGSRRFARDLVRSRSRATTTELVPLRKT